MPHKSAEMNTKGGDKRLVPFFQVEFWEKKKLLAELGYTFTSKEGEEEYEKWKEAKSRAAVVKKEKPEAFVRDGGIADAHTSVGGRSTGEAITPDAPDELPESQSPAGVGEDEVPLPDVDPREVI